MQFTLPFHLILSQLNCIHSRCSSLFCAPSVPNWITECGRSQLVHHHGNLIRIYMIDGFGCCCCCNCFSAAIRAVWISNVLYIFVFLRCCYVTLQTSYVRGNFYGFSNSLWFLDESICTHFEEDDRAMPSTPLNLWWYRFSKSHNMIISHLCVPMSFNR